MIKSRFAKLLLLASFYLASLVIYIIFSCQDIITQLAIDNTLIKYVIVILSTVFSFISLLFVRVKKDFIQILLRSFAFVFTLVADYFLLVLDDYYIVGVSVFIVAQLLHAFSLRFQFDYIKRESILFAILRAIVPIILIIILLTTNFATPNEAPLYILILIYFPQLVFNFVETLYMFIKTRKKEALFLCIGFLLFIGCDIFVSLFKLVAYEYIIPVWLFYAPSQVLLSSCYLLNSLLNKE